MHVVYYKNIVVEINLLESMMNSLEIYIIHCIALVVIITHRLWWDGEHMFVRMTTFDESASIAMSVCSAGNPGISAASLDRTRDSCALAFLPDLNLPAISANLKPPPYIEIQHSNFTSAQRVSYARAICFDSMHVREILVIIRE
jgi:hypothetical protein